jgi:hypothetical protein
MPGVSAAFPEPGRARNKSSRKKPADYEMKRKK